MRAPPLPDAAKRHRADRTELWPGTWHPVCAVDELAEVGAFVAYEVQGLAAAVIRTGDGLAAYRNECTHRGARILEGEGRCLGERLVCPFHGWRWDFAGRIRWHQALPGSAGPLKPLDLARLRLVVDGGDVFVAFDGAAPWEDAGGERNDATDVAIEEAVVDLDWRGAAAATVAHLRVLSPRLDAGVGGVIGADGRAVDAAAFTPAAAMLDRMLPPATAAALRRERTLPGYLRLACAGGHVSIRIRPASPDRARVRLWRRGAG